MGSTTVGQVASLYPFDWAYGTVDGGDRGNGTDVAAAQEIQQKVTQDEGNDEADLEGGVSRHGGGGAVASRASMAMMPCVEGIHGARDGARVCFDGEWPGPGNGWGGVEGAVRTKLGHQADFAVCCGM